MKFNTYLCLGGKYLKKLRIDGNFLTLQKLQTKTREHPRYLMEKYRIIPLLSRTRKEMSIDNKVWGFWPTPYTKKKRIRV